MQCRFFNPLGLSPGWNGRSALSTCGTNGWTPLGAPVFGSFESNGNRTEGFRLLVFRKSWTTMSLLIIYLPSNFFSDVEPFFKKGGHGLNFNPHYLFNKYADYNIGMPYEHGAGWSAGSYYAPSYYTPPVRRYYYPRKPRYYGLPQLPHYPRRSYYPRSYGYMPHHWNFLRTCVVEDIILAPKS